MEKKEEQQTEEYSNRKDKRKAASLTIRLLENWGHSSIVGLNHVEVFDSRGKRIAVAQDNIVNPNKRLIKLFTGKVFTTDEENMWWTPLSR